MRNVSRRHALLGLGGAAVTGMTAACGTIHADAARRKSVPEGAPATPLHRPGSLLWHFQAGSGIAQPIIAASGVLYAGVGGRTDYTSGTYAIDASRGTQLWHVQSLTAPNPDTVAAGTVFGVGGDDSDVIYALNAATGRTQWTVRATHLNPGAGNLRLGYTDQTIYASARIDGKSAILAVDGRTGRRRWAASFAQVVEGFAVADGVVFAGMAMRANANTGRVVALDGQTGKSLWDTADVSPIPETLVIVGDTVSGSTYQPGGTQTFALDRTTGRPLWHLSLGRVFDAAAGSGLVIVHTGDGSQSSTVWAVAERTGSIRWKCAFRSIVSALSASGNAVYIGCDDMLYAMAAASGAHLWSYRLSDSVCDIAVDQATVYVGDFSGAASIRPTPNAPTGSGARAGRRCRSGA